MTKTHQITIYKDSKGDFRWRMTAKNTKVVAESGEGYKRKSAMMMSLNRMLTAILSGSSVVVVDSTKAK